MARDYDDELDAWLAGDDGEPLNIDEPPPTLEDEEAVDRMLRRVARLRAEGNGIVAAHQRKIDEIRERAADLVAGIEAAVAWTERSLLAYAAQAFKDAPKSVRTIRLPSGDLMRRAQQPRVPDLTDDAAEVVHAQIPALAPSGKPKIAKTVVKEMCDPGKALGKADEEGYVPHQALFRTVDAEGVVTRTPVPGLIILVPTTDKITYKEK